MQILEFEKPIVALEEKLHQLLAQSEQSDIDLSDQIEEMRVRLTETKEKIYANLTPWQRVQIARHTQRPFMLDYINYCFDDFLELHGDRHIGDDN